MAKTGVLFNLFIVVLILFIVNFSSCGLFDKEIKQDKHIAEFKRQLSRVGDSLNTSSARINAFKTILERIEADQDIVSLRKRNMLLIEGYFYLSNEYTGNKSFDKALEYNDIALSLDSTDARGFFNRGCIYSAMEQDSLAVKDYTRAISINNDYVDAYYNRGIINEKLGNYENALADYDNVIKQNPHYIADVYNNRGNTYLSLENLEKALDDYTQALSIDSLNMNAYTNRIGLYIKRKEFEKAVTDCNKAIRIEPKYIRLYYQRAVAREMMKDYEDALLDYRRVVELDPHNKNKAKVQALEAIQKLQVLAKNK